MVFFIQARSIPEALWNVRRDEPDCEHVAISPGAFQKRGSDSCCAAASDRVIAHGEGFVGL
jgi:hypothetical protein